MAEFVVESPLDARTNGDSVPFVPLSGQKPSALGSHRPTSLILTTGGATAHKIPQGYFSGIAFRIMRQTFVNRGLYQQRRDGTLREVDWVGWTPWLDRRAFAFVLDTGTLPVSIERLTDEKVIHQVSTALGGRRVEVVNHRGVAWLLAMDLPPLIEDPSKDVAAFAQQFIDRFAADVADRLQRLL